MRIMRMAILIVAIAKGQNPGSAIYWVYYGFWVGFPGSSGGNLPARQKTWVWSLGWEDPLEEGMATLSSILAWKIPMDRGAWRVTVHGGHKESDTIEQLSTAQDSFRKSLIQFFQPENGNSITHLAGLWELETLWKVSNIAQNHYYHHYQLHAKKKKKLN